MSKLFLFPEIMYILLILPLNIELFCVIDDDSPPAVKSSSVADDLEAELEADLENMNIEDIDTSDVNLDDEGLLED